MDAAEFEKIIQKVPAEYFVPFSQYKFKNLYLPRYDFNLCSALVQIWFYSKKNKIDYLESLHSPSNELLQKVLNIQNKSIYPVNVKPSNFEKLSSEDKLLFTNKYGTSDWQQLSNLLVKENVSGFLEYDIQKAYDSTIFANSNFSHYSNNVPLDLIQSRPGISFALIILRFQKSKAKNEKWYGHRLGVYYQDDGKFAFFDPDIGEVVYKEGEKFIDFLNRIGILLSTDFGFLSQKYLFYLFFTLIIRND